MGLGAVNTVSLAIAQEKARQSQLLLSEGKDPILARDAARTADAMNQARFKTFDQRAAAYIKAHRTHMAVRLETGQFYCPQRYRFCDRQ